MECGEEEKIITRISFFSDLNAKSFSYWFDETVGEQQGREIIL